MKAKSSIPKPLPLPTVTFLAGCGRTWALESDQDDLAYTALEFVECPTCPHRVEPETTTGLGQPFCTLRPQDRKNPFSSLVGMEWPDE